jgi:hypothetical protein
VNGLKHQKEKRSMDHFAGLDVSLKETSVCIVDDTGRIVREVKDSINDLHRNSLGVVRAFATPESAWIRTDHLGADPVQIAATAAECQMKGNRAQERQHRQGRRDDARSSFGTHSIDRPPPDSARTRHDPVRSRNSFDLSTCPILD